MIATPTHIDDTRSPGAAAADRLASTIGSWRFLILQSCFLSLWLALNIVAFSQHWDPYPFILLNLCLSFQAAYTGAILLIANNRQAEVDRQHAEKSYAHTDEILQIQHTQLELLSELHQHRLKTESS